MKQRILALACALALMLGLAACTISTPDTVGNIGDFEITSGLYLLAQFDAYQKAADLASEDQDPTDVKAFLKQTVTTDADSGETALVSDYVAQETLATLESFAAAEARFAALGGELTADEEATADSYAEQLMEQYGTTYEANGIGLETVKRFERILLKTDALLELVYGENGETPVTDAELTDYLENEAIYAAYTSVPLYNTSTFAFADDDQKAEMLSLAQSAVDSYNAAIPETASAQQSAFEASVTAALPELYAVLDSDASSATGFSSGLLSEDVLTSAFTDEDAAALRELKPGEGAVVSYSSYALMFVVRLDAIEAAGLDSLRDTALSAMKSDELTDSLTAYGAELEHDLDSSAMAKLPAKKIVNS